MLYVNPHKQKKPAEEEQIIAEKKEEANRKRLQLLEKAPSKMG